MITARIEPRVIPTYPIGDPEKNPVFFEKRVYQGSSGKVYPVPFIDKVYDEPVPVTYQSALLENDYVRLVMLPEIGGRIFLGQDKTNNDYDFFYRQDVIKPALVGLAGPWISGGVEFNWPQHHRPGTFMPADVTIEEEPDGARTVWMSEHDPLNRLKGMHGIRLRPDSSLIELRARLYNRTPQVHTFLWWANVAAMVHDQYQSFFPPDVHYVADHAVRAMSSFPAAANPYYGVDYQNRTDGTDRLDWYRNIPVPTSYMICQTEFDFFGGYDHAASGGFVHVANRHISPGKKQWTWGNHPFGWAWDRELTDENGPYVELMAGVYTDNQPDFSYLMPYETKTFSQFWWPIQNIGPVQQANQQAALACTVGDDKTIQLGLCVSSLTTCELQLYHRDQLTFQTEITLEPGEDWQDRSQKFVGDHPHELRVELVDANGSSLLSYQPVDSRDLTRDRVVATEPPEPTEVESTDQLFLVGEHLEQYRHPTRDPELYWTEALNRDPEDSRSLTAIGKRALARGEFLTARDYFLRATKRLTSRHPNPISGEAHYHLGLAERWIGNLEAAYQTFYKATWNYAWRSASYYQLATLDCIRQDWSAALQHLEASLDTNRNHNKALVLKALVHSNHLSRDIVEELLDRDPLDHWARHLPALFSEKQNFADFLAKTRNDAQTILDLAFDYSEAGFYQHAIDLLQLHIDHEVTEVSVPNPLERAAMVHYTLAWLESQIEGIDSTIALQEARQQSADHFFPSRLEEMRVLEWAIAQPGTDPVACYGLGNFYYDRRRYDEAIAVWEQAAACDVQIPQVHRNLGIAYWNQQTDGAKAAQAYEKAMQLAPDDVRLVSEYDQLAKKRNCPLDERLHFLQQRKELVLQRDDATVELATLLNLSGEPQQALDLLLSQRFHPWEGGEGAVLRQYTTARLLLGQAALDAEDPAEAHRQFSLAFDTPESLGEAYHLLQAKADVNYWLGRSLAALGRGEEAQRLFTESANEAGDFTEMAVTKHSPLSYYRGLSLRALGREEDATEMFRSLLSYAEDNIGQPAKIDYFATSLPNLLVFDEDLQARRDAEFHLLAALANHGLGEVDHTRTHLDKMLTFDSSNQQAADLQRKLKVSE